MENNWSKTRQQFPLSPKKIIKKTITTIAYPLLFFLVLFVSFGFALSFYKNVSDVLYLLSLYIGLLLIIFAIYIVLIYLYQMWYFKVYFYELKDDILVIRKNPLTPKEITIPYEKIQDVYVDQDIFDRIFGLYDVHVSSPTYSSFVQAHIDGVEKSAADSLRDLLVDASKKKSNIGQVI